MTYRRSLALLLVLALTSTACGPGDDADRPYCRFDGDAPAVTDRAACEDAP